MSDRNSDSFSTYLKASTAELFGSVRKTLRSMVIALLATAILGRLGLMDEEWGKKGVYMLTVLAITVLLFAIVAPFGLWREQRQRIREQADRIRELTATPPATVEVKYAYLRATLERHDNLLSRADQDERKHRGGHEERAQTVGEVRALLQRACIPAKLPRRLADDEWSDLNPLQRIGTLRNAIRNLESDWIRPSFEVPKDQL